MSLTNMLKRNPNQSERPFTVFSSIEPHNPQRCYILYADASKANRLMDLIDKSDYLEALAYYKRATFMVDTQFFLNCVVVEVQYKNCEKLKELLNVEAVSAALMMDICEELKEDEQ